MYYVIYLFSFIVTFIIVSVVLLPVFFIITNIVNRKVSKFFGFCRLRFLHRNHNQIHLQKLFYSFPILIKYAPTQIREIFKNDLINYAIPKTLKLKPNTTIFIVTHLITQEDLVLISEYPNITYLKHSPTPDKVLFTQLTATVAWLLRIIFTRRRYSFPKIYGRTWYKIIYSNTNK